jgi:hypothetical protein
MMAVPQATKVKATRVLFPSACFLFKLTALQCATGLVMPTFIAL